MAHYSDYSRPKQKSPICVTFQANTTWSTETLQLTAWLVKPDQNSHLGPVTPHYLKQFFIGWIPLGDFLDFVEFVDLLALVGVWGGLVDGRKGVGRQHLRPERERTVGELHRTPNFFTIAWSNFGYHEKSPNVKSPAEEKFPSPPNYLPNLTTYSKAIFYMPCACGGLSGPLLSYFYIKEFFVRTFSRGAKFC